MKTVLLIPDGVGVRNFLLGDFLPQIAAAGDCHVLHTVPEQLLPLYQQPLTAETSQTVHWHQLEEYSETPLAGGLRYAVGYAHMYWGNTHAMRHTLLHKIRGSWRNRAMHKGAKLLGRMLAFPVGIQALDRQHSRTVSRLPIVAHYRRLFERLQPSVIFCSHQRPPSVVPPVLAAREMGIPTATFIFSWDNLSSKGRIAAPFDHYLVWSELMRKELLTFYPDIVPERVHLVGTPQFDPYAKHELLWTRDEFCRRIGADPARPLICYSGGDTMTAIEDHHFVRDLMEFVRAGQIKGNPQVVVRPAPVDSGERFTSVRRDYPEMIFAQPEWVHTVPGDWSRTVPTAADIQFLANITEHADLNINLASTMTLDFALHNRPVVNAAYDVTEPPLRGSKLLDYYYQYEHYRVISEIGAARIARTRAELMQHVNDYLSDPNLDHAARQRLVELEVDLPIGQSTRRITEVLRHLAGEPAKQMHPATTHHHLSSAEHPTTAPIINIKKRSA